jgi:hypothetical protein
MQPLNFMIGTYTFERPSDWKWIQTEGQDEKARLFVLDKASNERSIITFEVTGGTTVSGLVEKWTSPFRSDTNVLSVVVKTNTLNRHQVVSVDIVGTKSMSKKLVPDQMTHAVVLVEPGENITARILGSKKSVSQLEPVFSKMIETALAPHD